MAKIGKTLLELAAEIERRARAFVACAQGGAPAA